MLELTAESAVLEKTSHTQIQDEPSTVTERALLHNVMWLRLCEEKIVSLYHEQEMRTPCHFATGQEGIATAVCKSLKTTDAVYSHHRCHNHFLAMGGGFFELVAELYGKIEGCSNGRGGSVHLTSRKTGFIVSSAILAETVAVATGSALAFKMDGLPHVAVTFFGDGSCEEGSFYESLGFASLFKLPVIFICENNLYSTESHLNIRQPEGATFLRRAQSLGISGEIIDGNDLFAVYNTMQKILPAVRNGSGPYFLECNTYRWREHVGPNFDFDVPNRNYRSKEEQQFWINERCPVKIAQAKMLADGKITSDELHAWQKAMETEIEYAVAKAKQSEWPKVERLLDNVW